VQPDAAPVPGRPAAATRPDPAYAGLVTRSMGLAVDVALLTLVCLTVGALPATAWQAVLGTPPGWLSGASAVAAGQVPWLYFALCWWITGQTAGGVLMGEWVRRPDGGRLSPWRAAARSLVGLALAPVWMVGLLATLTDPRRRAWHDRAFGTVVRRERRAAGAD
jgi:uncharacterized RDD family membrane protein YckC